MSRLMHKQAQLLNSPCCRQEVLICHMSACDTFGVSGLSGAVLIVKSDSSISPSHTAGQAACH